MRAHSKYAFTMKRFPFLHTLTHKFNGFCSGRNILSLHSMSCFCEIYALTRCFVTSCKHLMWPVMLTSYHEHYRLLFLQEFNRNWKSLSATKLDEKLTVIMRLTPNMLTVFWWVPRVPSLHNNLWWHTYAFHWITFCTGAHSIQLFLGFWSVGLKWREWDHLNERRPSQFLIVGNIQSYNHHPLTHSSSPGWIKNSYQN